jgi:broad specificity phosphatase PhoE
VSKLFVVRHGQASFFADDYDRLSERGEAQSARLGEHWLARGLELTGAYCGTLQRQRRTGEVVAQTYADAGAAFPQLDTLGGLDEYPADDIMARLLPALREADADIGARADAFESATESRDRYRTFHRLLEAVMARWLRGEYPDAPGLPTWHDFSDGVRSALAQIMREAGSGARVAVFTSGGPIGVSVQTALSAPEIKALELNWRVHNGSVTEYTFSGGRVSLDGFNLVSHLPPDMLTFR